MRETLCAQELRQDINFKKCCGISLGATLEEDKSYGVC